MVLCDHLSSCLQRTGLGVERRQKAKEVNEHPTCRPAQSASCQDEVAS